MRHSASNASSAWARVLTGLAVHDLHLVVAQPQVIGQSRRIGDRGRQADETRLRGERRQAGETKRQMMATLGGGERMQLIDDHRAQVGKEARGVRVAQQQGERLRRGQQKVGRPFALADPPALRRVAGPALGPHRQRHLGDRHFEVAPDVGRQRLERRDVERVQLALALLVGEVPAGLSPFGELDQRGQEAGQGLAASRGGDQQCAFALGREIDQRELVRPRRPAPAFEPA